MRLINKLVDGRPARRYNRIKHNPIKKWERSVKVTQLIGALCEGRTKVVLISDRMVTAADFTLGFEHEPKFTMMSPFALVLSAGTIHEPELLEDASANITGVGIASMRQTAESISESYRKIRKKRVEDEILSCYGLSSFDDFYQKQRLLHEDTNMRILNDIENYGSPENGGLGAQFIVGGVDHKKAHVYAIGDPGTYRSYDSLGYCCLGIGSRHAEPVFAFFQFKPSLKVSETLQIAYAAKKRAEMAGGVGKETDAWIVTEEGSYEITRETIDKLEDFYQKKEGVSQLWPGLEIKTRRLMYPPKQAAITKKEARVTQRKKATH